MAANPAQRGPDAPRSLLARAGLVRERQRPEPETADFLTASVTRLAELLSGEFRFRLTCYQRTYSWRAKQALRLLADIRAAMQREPAKRRYCLGRLMLARRPGKLDTELVDGHQRLMTLTILFAILRDLEPDAARRAELHAFIAGEDEYGSSRPLYRLAPQNAPSLFVEQFVQEPGATHLDPEHDLSELSDTERNIFENRECLLAEIVGLDDETRRSLANFLANHCYVIVVLAEDQDEAWDIMFTEQETRLEFTEADQSKAVLLSAMPPEDRLVCGRMWEGCEARLTATDMHKLLGHIRSMKWRGRNHNQSHKPVEDDIIEHFGLVSGGYAFMEQELCPHAERLNDIRRGAIGADTASRAAIATHITYMTWIDAHSWVPAALHWLSVRGETDPECRAFFARLERLVWMMKLAGFDPGVQETRFLALMGEIERWLKVDSMSKLAIEREMYNPAVTNLRNQGFAGKHHAGLVLRRISIALGADPGPISRNSVTLEHILPRNPKENGPWSRNFRSKADVQAYAQRLGNVALLSPEENQEVANLDWSQKRKVFARSRFELARRASEEPEWTVTTIANRTEDLIGILFGLWDLEV